MSSKFRLLTTLVLFGGIVVAPYSSAATPRSAAMLANTCAGCHGTDGYSAGGHMPSLAGLNSRYLYQAMVNYQNDVRPSTIMGRIARGYSDNELKAMAAYFAAKPWQQAAQIEEGSLSETGSELHQQLCASCHQDEGRSQQRDTPRLAGQWHDYLFDQLTDMQQGGGYHGSHPAKMLQRVEQLSSDQLRAISHFYASQK
ncbi:cytochrome c4 [Ectothiorhodospiraceae bacterium BW-2]|nr:cytochrome c4 [Ectothiorhodospiraceae bacterium BW-2]